MPAGIYGSEHERIVARLRRARLDAGLGQTDVAGKIGKTQSYVSKIESGQRKVDVLQLKELAELYGKPLGYFLE